MKVGPQSRKVAHGFHQRLCILVTLLLAWLAVNAARAQTTNYALGTTRLTVGPAAGTNSVVLGVNPATGVWAATANAGWLHLSPANQNGTGSGNVVFSYDANPGGTRFGILTIAGQTLTVTQAGSTYVTALPLTTLVPPLAMPADTEGPFGMSVDGMGNTCTLFTDPPLNSSSIVKWSLTNNSLSEFPLPQSIGGINEEAIVPGNILAADGAGNVYIADPGNNAVQKWLAGTSNVTNLVTSGLNYPIGVAVDGTGNVYIADASDNAIKKWTASSSNLTTLVSLGSNNYPLGVAVDAAGNVYIADALTNMLMEWTAANSNLTTLVSLGAHYPQGVAVDGSGNIYLADSYNGEVLKWTAANSNVTTLASGFSTGGVAVDGAGNVYVTYPITSELPNAFLDPAGKSEGPGAGNDSLPAVLPATLNLLPPFAPTSSGSWLTITGTVNGVVSFSFTANPGFSRTAYITLLGQSIPVTQAGLAIAPTYSLGESTSLVGPAAGTSSVVLAVAPANAAWSATANAGWLHLSAVDQNGAGSTNVVFSYDANPGATRSGSLTIAGQTLTVTQAGSTYSAAGVLTTLTSAPLSPTGYRFPSDVAVDVAGNVYFADELNNAIREWLLASNTVITLVSSGLQDPEGLFVDPAGNVYIADTDDWAVKEWMATNGNLITLVSTNLENPYAVAVDGAGNVYIADTDDNAIKVWTAANGSLNTIVQGSADGVAVDVAGNVYFSDLDHNAVKEWTAANNTVTTLVSSGLNGPRSVTVDGAGNVCFADFNGQAVREWMAATSNLTTVVSTGLDMPTGAAEDSAGNIYIADTFDNAIKELPRAFVDGTPKLEAPSPGSDSLPVVLPATENLLAPFAPTSDSSWLSITGVADGVVSFSFTTNAGAARTGHITLLGLSVPIMQVSQAMIGTPPALTSVQMLGGGVLQFAFTNNPNAVFTVLSTTDVSLPLSEWTAVGSPAYAGSNVFQFTSQPTTNDQQRFYTVRSP
jgi:DNA-binding beta-propeller fold protein YncE